MVIYVLLSIEALRFCCCYCGGRVSSSSTEEHLSRSNAHVDNTKGMLIKSVVLLFFAAISY